jgi:hypothetical protein
MPADSVRRIPWFLCGVTALLVACSVSNASTLADRLRQGNQAQLRGDVVPSDPVGLVHVVMPDDLRVSPAWLFDLPSQDVLRISEPTAADVLGDLLPRDEPARVVVVGFDAAGVEIRLLLLQEALEDHGIPIEVVGAVLERDTARVRTTRTIALQAPAEFEPPAPEPARDPSPVVARPAETAKPAPAPTSRPEPGLPWAWVLTCVAATGGLLVWALRDRREPIAELPADRHVPAATPQDARLNEAIEALEIKLHRWQTEWRRRRDATGDALHDATAHGQAIPDRVADARGSLSRLRVRILDDAGSRQLVERADGSLAEVSQAQRKVHAAVGQAHEALAGRHAGRSVGRTGTRLNRRAADDDA